VEVAAQLVLSLLHLLLYGEANYDPDMGVKLQRPHLPLYYGGYSNSALNVGEGLQMKGLVFQV